MPSRGRHQSTSKECRRAIKKIEALDGVQGVIIGLSYGGKSLGKNKSTGDLKIQRIEDGGLKAATQSAKGLQELFIRTESGREREIADKIAELIDGG
jgi:2-keto-3-deoxy-L-rhamnonate aldolase RhmA